MSETKTELIEKLSEISYRYTELGKEDDRRRKEFAKAFNWRKKPRLYDTSDPEPHLPSWEEIFVEIGKLLHGNTSFDKHEG